MTPAKTSSPRKAARTLFRNAILDAAERVFGAKGFHASRIQDIAAEAGVGVGTVYNHFAQKEDVLRALLDERTAEMIELLLPGDGEPEVFEARLKARMTRVLRYVDGHRGYFRLLMTFGMIPETADESMKKIAGSSLKRVTAVRKSFGALIQEGIDAGAIAPVFDDPVFLSAFLGATLRAITFKAIQRNDPDLAVHAGEITRLFLHGCAAPPKGRP